MTLHIKMAQRLRLAADLLKSGEWMQGDYTDGLGAFCVVGAIYAAPAPAQVAGILARRDFDRIPERRVADAAIHRVTTEARSLGHLSASRWNDDPNQNANNVIETLQRIAAEIEIEAGGEA